MVVHPDGQVLTAHHIIADRTSITVHLADGSLEVWGGAVESHPWTEDAPDGTTGDSGTIDQELGFAKYRDKWQLVTRTVTYRGDDNRGWEALSISHTYRPLLEASREQRIEALTLFPDLVEKMKSTADEAVTAIQAAKKFVK